MSRPLPRKPVPPLDLPLIDGGRFVLADSKPQAFTMLVFYRGLHCPLCQTYLAELQDRLDQFSQLGIEAVAISMDSEKRARIAQEDWGLPQLRIAYGLSEDDARAYGLYLTDAVFKAEPRRFSEPGLFLVRPDTTLYFASFQTMPFGRSSFEEIISVVGKMVELDYPARGEAA